MRAAPRRVQSSDNFDAGRDVVCQHLPVSVFLTTDRLVLRRFTEADVDNLVELDSDPAVMRYLTGGKATPRERIRDEIIPRILGYYEHYSGLGTWAADERFSGRFLGWMGLHPEDGRDPSEAELGYRLRRPAWGQGYATEGSRALIRKGFTEYGLRRVFATTMTVNAASRRVMEKCGLTFVRTFHESWPETIDGSEHGDVEYALERDEWERREASG
jgi:RimJ/RimL family protein N-acetyltransferase